MAEVQRASERLEVELAATRQEMARYLKELGLSAGWQRSRGCFPDPTDEVAMSAIKGTWKNGQIILDAQADWPEGCRLTIVPEPLPEIAFMTEDEQGDDPESIRRWLAAFDAIPPLSMPPEEEAEWQAWRQEVKEYNVEAVRRQMVEGLP